MLHAINRKKARIDVFRGPGQRVPIEDVVTSTVFGPLLFLESAEASKFVSLMLRKLDISPPDWTGPAHLSLWPKKPFELHRTRYVEPDAEISDAAGNALLIEVKWGAPLGENELASQWLSLGTEARANSRHLLITLEAAPYRKAVDEDRKVIAETCRLPWQVYHVTWRRLAEAFGTVGRNIELNAGTRRWALAVNAFLRREDPRSVAGWGQIEMNPVSGIEWRFADRLAQLFAMPAAVRISDGWFRAARSTLRESQWSFTR